MPRGGSRRYFKQLRFQQLQGFCEIARRRSFAAAAAELRVSRPALWQQVRALERELATPLVQRKGRGVELTEDGQVLLELAGPLVSGFASIRLVFADRRGEIHRRLCVASPPSLLATQVRGVVREFRDRYPQVHLTLVDATSPEVLRMVEDGEADLGLAGLFPDESDYGVLEYEPLFTHAYVLICPPGHPLGRRRVLRLEALTRYPFVLMARETLTRTWVERVFRERGLWKKVNVVMETKSYPLVLEYVALGLGISVVARNPTEDLRQRLEVYPAARWFGEETTALVWRKGAYQPEHVRGFREIVHRALANPSLGGR
jgi:DNA-binding transcriptional LysR family regulator